LEFAGLTERIALLTPRVVEVAARIDETLLRQTRDLEGIAVEELQARLDRLSTYRVQARFALASIYDRASARVDAIETGDVSLGQFAEVDR
jgi:hypothetical protein